MTQMQTTQKGPKACSTCAKAKARCIPRDGDGDKCDRCHRLQKDCFSRPPAPPRSKKRAKRSRVAELEKRLNELSSQFECVQSTSNTTTRNNNDASTTATSIASSAPRSVTKTIVKPNICSYLFPSPSPTRDEDHEPSTWGSEVMKALNSPWPLTGESEMLLKAYREMFAGYFPFVPIPPDLSSAELRAQRPFLWKAVIMGACIFDSSKHLKLGDELLADISQAAIVTGSRSLDLLQAVQLLIGWYYFALKSSQVANLLFLARSMCVSLSSISYDSQGEDAKYGPLDHLRAYAGTYYLNTVVFTANKKTDVLMNTAQLDHCCKVIRSAMEYPSDEYLLKLVEIQRLAQDICVAMAADGTAPPMAFPLTMAVQSFQDQVNTFHASLSPKLAQSATLRCHIFVAESLLRDIAISDHRCNPENMLPSERLELLWACVNSLRCFFEIRFAEPEIDKPRFLCVTASDLAYTLITGIKLTMLQLPDWDAKSIKTKLDIVDILEKQINHMHDAITHRRSGLLSADRCAKEDPLERHTRLMRTAKELVSMHISGSSSFAVVDDVSTVAWREMINDGSWLDESQENAFLDF